MYVFREIIIIWDAVSVLMLSDVDDMLCCDI